MKAGVSVKEFYLDKGAAREQERIIKLLEDFDDGDLWRAISAGSFVGFDVAELIALIKGEK